MQAAAAGKAFRLQNRHPVGKIGFRPVSVQGGQEGQTAKTRAADKRPRPMCERSPGSVTSAREVQPAKAYLSILTSLLPDEQVTLSSCSQSINALAPIYETVSGRTILRSLRQPAKAPSPILSVPAGTGGGRQARLRRTEIGISPASFAVKAALLSLPTRRIPYLCAFAFALMPSAVLRMSPE